MLASVPSCVPGPATEPAKESPGQLFSPWPTRPNATTKARRHEKEKAFFVPSCLRGYAFDRAITVAGDSFTNSKGGHSRRRTITRATAGLCAATIALAATTGCGRGSRLVLTEQIEARRLAADLRVQLSKAADASNRAVMAVTDEASSAAAREAEQATQAVERDVEALQRSLQTLAYPDEIRHLDTFKRCFVGYRALDADLLPLAVENTNIKAQRLSFGPAREAASAFRESLEGAGRAVTSQNACCVDALVTRATAAVLEVQVIQARHIAESDEAVMTRMEADMAASEAAARKTLDALQALLPPAAGPRLAAAAAALDRFTAINTELVTLSRRNSNVRSLALSLGRKRTVTAECDDSLHALADALAKHDFTATR